MRKSASISVQYENAFAPFPGKEYKAGMKWVKESGFDGVELIISDPNRIDIEKVKHSIDEVGLEVSTISTGQAVGLEKIAMTSAAEYIREAARQRLMDDINFSEQLGKPNVTIGLIRGRGGEMSLAEERELLIRELYVVGEYAEKKGIVLNLEPINRYEVKLLNSSLSAYELLEGMGNPKNIGILYDTFHSNIEDDDMLATIRRIGNKISHVHLADSNRQLPGEGHIDFKSILKTLTEIGYDGYVSLEVLNKPDASHIIANTKQRMLALF